MPTPRADTYTAASGATVRAGRASGASLPQWLPAPGEVAVLTPANGLLSNTFVSQVASGFNPFYSCKIVNDYSGAVLNQHYGTYGAVLFNGAGHSASCDNSTVALEIGFSACTFRRLTNPPDFHAADGVTNNNIGNPAISSDWGEYVLDGSPASRHSYGDFAVVGPLDGGAAYGTLYSVQPSSLGNAGVVLARHAAHKLDITSLSGTLSYARAGSIDPVGYGARAVVWSEHVPPQGRIYTEASGAQIKPRWFDLASGQYVVGNGTAKTLTQDGSDGGTLIHIPERQLLLHIAGYGGNLNVKYMDVSVTDPSWVNTLRTMGAAIPVAASWSCACWCKDSGKIIVGNVNGDPGCVYEIGIPADLNDPWPCTRAALPAGQAISWPAGSGHTYKKWSYNPLVRAIVFFPDAMDSGNDSVFVYRPRGT